MKVITILLLLVSFIVFFTWYNSFYIKEHMMGVPVPTWTDFRNIIDKKTEPHTELVKSRFKSVFGRDIYISGTADKSGLNKFRFDKDKPAIEERSINFDSTKVDASYVNDENLFMRLIGYGGYYALVIDKPDLNTFTNFVKQNQQQIDPIGQTPDMLIPAIYNYYFKDVIPPIKSPLPVTSSSSSTSLIPKTTAMPVSLSSIRI